MGIEGPILNCGSCLTTSRCFNGAATLSLRRLFMAEPAPVADLLASMGPQLYRCGDSSCMEYGTPARIASMGPQLYRCGDWHVRILQVPRRLCFNGAATLSLRRLIPLLPQRVLRYHRFNGAATLSLRRLVNITNQFDYVNMLQWGRNFIVAETYGLVKVRLGASARFNGAATLSLRRLSGIEAGASQCMTLQWGRNFIVAET